YITPVDGITAELIEQELEGEFGQLFPYGYGLNYAGQSDIAATEADLNNLPLDARYFGCGIDEPVADGTVLALDIFGKYAKDEFSPRMSGNINDWSAVQLSKDVTTIGSVTTTGINYQGMQQSAINVKFSGNVGEFENKGAAQIYMQTPDAKGVDFQRYINANATMEFDIRMISSKPAELILSTHCGYPCRGELNIASVLPVASSDWTRIKVPLQCFEDVGMSFQMLNTAFLLHSKETTEFDLGNVRYVPHPQGLPNDAISCKQLIGK
ncbi:MAG: putative glycoside hydrolase, partial [Shewanella sp.]